VRDAESLHQALIAIATIVDDTDNSSEGRLEGIRGVLAAIGMLHVRLPLPNPAPRTPAEARLEDILKAAAQVTPSSPTPRSSPPARKPAYKPRARYQRAPPKTRQPERKPLVDDPDRQERIRREFSAGQRKKKRRAGKESK
jgi:hypothetical protein